MVELTGIQKGTGAKMKADIQPDHVVFRGAIKKSVPFAQLSAEARGTLLCLMFDGITIELAAGSKASKFASEITKGK